MHQKLEKHLEKVALLSSKSDITVNNSILTQHLKQQGNLENHSAYRKTRRTHIPLINDMELFQKNRICFPQKFFLHKSSDTVPNPAVGNTIKPQLVPGLSCRSSMWAPVPWAVTRAGCSAAARRVWWCHVHTLFCFCLQGSLSLIMIHKPERSHAN